MKKAALLLTAFLLSALAGCGNGGEASSVQHGTYTDSGEASSVQHGIYTDGVVESFGEFTEETYSGTVTDRYTESGLEMEALTLTLDDGAELHFSFLKITEIKGAEDVAMGDEVEIESGYYELSSGYHPIFSITVK